MAAATEREMSGFLGGGGCSDIPLYSQAKHPHAKYHWNLHPSTSGCSLEGGDIHQDVESPPQQL